MGCRWGGRLRGGTQAGSDIDGDTRAAPGEGYDRANGKRSSNELSWGGHGGGGEKKTRTHLSLPNVMVKVTGQESRRSTDTNTAPAHPDDYCNPPPG